MFGCSCFDMFTSSSAGITGRLWFELFVCAMLSVHSILMSDGVHAKHIGSHIHCVTFFNSFNLGFRVYNHSFWKVHLHLYVTYMHSCCINVFCRHRLTGFALTQMQGQLTRIQALLNIKNQLRLCFDTALQVINLWHCIVFVTCSILLVLSLFLPILLLVL